MVKTETKQKERKERKNQVVKTETKKQRSRKEVRRKKASTKVRERERNSESADQTIKHDKTHCRPRTDRPENKQKNTLAPQPGNQHRHFETPAIPEAEVRTKEPTHAQHSREHSLKTCLSKPCYSLCSITRAKCWLFGSSMVSMVDTR